MPLEGKNLNSFSNCYKTENIAYVFKTEIQEANENSFCREC